MSRRSGCIRWMLGNHQAMVKGSRSFHLQPFHERAVHKERHGHGLLEELALTGGQQRAAGAAGGCGAGRELGGVKGVAVAGQPAAGGGELGQRGAWQTKLSWN